MSARPVRLVVAAMATVAACSGSDDGSSEGGSTTSATVAATSTATSSAAATAPGSAPEVTTPADPQVGDGFTITAATAEAANTCFASWHSVQAAATTSLTYDPLAIEAIVATCAEADALLDEDNRGAPEGPLPAHMLSATIAQVLIASSNQMRTARDQCGSDVCPLGGDPALFLVLSRDGDDAFSGLPAEPPTVDDIDGLQIR